MATRWGAPRNAYLFTALIAEGDDSAAAAKWKGLVGAERPDMIIALGAQARYAAHLTGRLRGPGAERAIADAQADKVRHALGDGRVRDYVIGALSGASADAAAPECELYEGAVAIARAALHALYAAGISRMHAALIARRSARHC